jgi:hypothetical protein
MRRAIVLTGLIALALATGAEAATLNKCIDANGEVTYSNLPCRGAREVKRVEIDPPPPPPKPAPVKAVPQPVPPPQPSKSPAEAAPEPAPTPMQTVVPQAPPAPIQPQPDASLPPAVPPSPQPSPTVVTPPRASQPVARASASKCDTLSDKLGRVFDKMDLARRKGYTQEQMDKWNLEVKDLERKKQQSGCF